MDGSYTISGKTLRVKTEIFQRSLALKLQHRNPPSVSCPIELRFSSHHNCMNEFLKIKHTSIYIIYYY